MKRRVFLMSGAAAFAQRAAPSDRIGIGVIGSGSRGTFVMGVFQKDPAVRINAICDVYEPNLEKALSAASKAQGVAPKAYRNYKELLADKSVDAVLIATPEHWHHRMVLDAMAAGKDVYIEKPLCHTPEQGVELVEAEKQSKQIVQVGMQRRSYDLYISARKVIAGGALGKVRMVRAWWLNNYLGRRPRYETGRQTGLATVARPGRQPRFRPGCFPQLARVSPVRRWDRRRSGRPRIRRHSYADERQLPDGCERVRR